MGYMTTREAAELWGYSESTIREWCKAGLIYEVQKAEKKSGRWRIPANAKCPRKQKRREKV